MTSTVFRNQLSSRGRYHARRNRPRLRHILRQAESEMERMSQDPAQDDSTMQSYRSTVHSMSTLLENRRETARLGHKRRKLIELLAQSEHTDDRSALKSFIDIRKADKMARPERCTKNTELFGSWLKSSAAERKSEWTRDTWADFQEKLDNEDQLTRRTNAALTVETKALEEIWLSRVRTLAPTVGALSTLTPREDLGDSSQGSQWLRRIQNLLNQKKENGSAARHWSPRKSSSTVHTWPSSMSRSAASSSDRQTATPTRGTNASHAPFSNTLSSISERSW